VTNTIKKLLKKFQKNKLLPSLCYVHLAKCGRNLLSNKCLILINITKYKDLQLSNENKINNNIFNNKIIINSNFNSIRLKIDLKNQSELKIKVTKENNTNYEIIIKKNKKLLLNFIKEIEFINIEEVQIKYKLCYLFSVDSLGIKKIWDENNDFKMIVNKKSFISYDKQKEKPIKNLFSLQVLKILEEDQKYLPFLKFFRIIHNIYFSYLK